MRERACQPLIKPLGNLKPCFARGTVGMMETKHRGGCVIRAGFRDTALTQLTKSALYGGTGIFYWSSTSGLNVGQGIHSLGFVANGPAQVLNCAVWKFAMRNVTVAMGSIVAAATPLFLRARDLKQRQGLGASKCAKETFLGYHHYLRGLEQCVCLSRLIEPLFGNLFRYFRLATATTGCAAMVLMHFFPTLSAGPDCGLHASV